MNICSRDTFESDEELTETWHYDKEEVSLSFDKEADWKLVSISVTSKMFELENKALIGSNKEELVQFLKELEVNDLETELIEDEDEMLLISSEENSINFWLEDNELTEIQWVPFFSEDDSINWPE